MQKYYAIDLSEQDGPMRAPVYRASDVDAFMTAAGLKNWATQANRIAELEKALNPRQWTAAQQEAWHRALPDVVGAFAALRSLMGT